MRTILTQSLCLGNGLTEGVLAEIENALNHHELIKVKVAGADRETKQLIINAIVRETKAAQVQTIGHILVLYRPSEEAKNPASTQITTKVRSFLTALFI